MQVLINNKLVTQTPWSPLDPNLFSVQFGAPFLISLPPSSALLTLVVIESSRGPLTAPSVLGSLQISLKGFNHQEKSLQKSFSCGKVFSYSHSAVGSAVPGDSFGSAKTEGKLLFKCKLTSLEGLKEAARGDERREVAPWLSKEEMVDPNNPLHSRIISSLPSGQVSLQLFFQMLTS